MITSRSQRRWLNLLGFGIVVALMSYALFSQHVLGLEACPLCIFQRIAIMSVGAVFLVAGLHSPTGTGARVYAAVGTVAAVVGASISGWHVRLQNLPPDEVPSCGPGLDYMLDAFPLMEALEMVFTGSGECAEVNWSFLGLSMPAWVLVWFVLLAALVVVANWNRVSRS
ncbi:MAG: disulfide bond formation protein B [Gammaproteobacteria bacterium]